MGDAELPAGWATCALGDIIAKPRPKVAPDPVSELPFIGMDHIEAESFYLSGQARFADMKSAGSYFLPGDVLYGRLRPYLNKVHRAKFEGVASAEFIVLPSADHFDSDFIKLLLHQRQFVEFAMSRSSGDRPRVKYDAIAAYEFALPPLPEQQRIVEKIETLFAELDKGEEALREVQKLLVRYRQSVLKAALTGGLTADWRADNGQEPWRDTTLDQLNSLLTSGSRGWAKFYAAEGDTFIRAQNLKHDRLDLNDVAFVSLPDRSEGTRTKVNVGDILITITGANVTKTALVERIEGTAYVSQHVALFRPSSEVHPEFLHRFIVAKAGGRVALEEAAYGAGKPGLNLQNIKDVRISLPPIDEQREIVDRLDHLLGAQFAIQADIDRQLVQGQSLRQSILKDAFSGKLVPQDPADEPAIKLLKRT
jgi:type I restriction enzyme S subunit